VAAAGVGGGTAGDAGGAGGLGWQPFPASRSSVAIQTGERRKAVRNAFMESGFSGEIRQDYRHYGANGSLCYPTSYFHPCRFDSSV
jgi:hypothetical protein